MGGIGLKSRSTSAAEIPAELARAGLYHVLIAGQAKARGLTLVKNNSFIKTAARP